MWTCSSRFEGCRWTPALFGYQIHEVTSHDIWYSCYWDTIDGEHIT